MNSIKTIIIKYVESFKECNICNYMCSPKHFTQSNYNKKVLIKNLNKVYHKFIDNNSRICNICMNDINKNN